MICKVKVVFPLLSGPYISIILPFGTPPIPSAISSPREPVLIGSAFTIGLSPNLTIAPSPQDLLIPFMAASRAFALSSMIVVSFAFAIPFLFKIILS